MVPQQLRTHHRRERQRHEQSLLQRDAVDAVPLTPIQRSGLAQRFGESKKPLALDTVEAIASEVARGLADLRADAGMSMILVSHDVGVVAQNSDSVAVMYAGKILEYGRVRDVLGAPRHPYTRGLLAAVPTLEAAGQRQPLESIPGQPPNLADLPRGCPFQPRCPFVRPECASIPVELDARYPAHGSACPFVN